MSPYRSTPTPGRSEVLRLGEPFPAAGLLLVGTVCFGPLPWAIANGDSIVGPCVFAALGALASMLWLFCRHRAWIVVMPNEERVRVVRSWAWSYSASTLRLSESMSVECSPIGNAMWLFIVASDGRAARVLPAASTSLVDRVDSFVKSCGTRRGTPSPR